MKLIRIFPAASFIRDVAWSPTGDQIAAAVGNGVQFWEASTGKTREPTFAHRGPTNAVSWRPDGKHLASGDYYGESSFRVWDAATGEPVREVEVGGGGLTQDIAWNPDGSLIAVRSGPEDLTIWRTSDWTLLKRFSVTHNPIAWSPDGRWLAAMQGPSLKTWDTRTWEIQHDLNNDHVSDLAWHPESTHIATSSRDTWARVWNLSSLKREAGVRNSNDLKEAIRWTPDTSWIVVAGDSGIRVRNALAELNLVSSISLLDHQRGDSWKTLDDIAFSPDGETIAVTVIDKAGQVRLLDGKTGQHRGFLKTNEELRNKPIHALAWSPNGKTLASGRQGQSIQRWSMPEGVPQPLLKGHKELVTSVAWSPDGHSMVSGGLDGARTWNLGTNMPDIQLNSDLVEAVTWSPDGGKIGLGVWTSDGNNYNAPIVEVRNATDGTLQKQFTGGAKGLEWSPNGKWIVAGGEKTSIRLLNPEDWSMSASLETEAEGHLCASWSHDSSRVAAITDSKTIEIWDLNNLLKLQTLAKTTGRPRALAQVPQ